jgi:hypothetical protein
VFDLDAPLEHAAHDFELDLVIQAELREDQIASLKTPRHMSRFPPKLFDHGPVLRFGGSGRNMSLVRGSLTSRASIVLVGDHSIAYIEAIGQVWFSGNAVEHRIRPNAVVNLYVILVENAPENGC